jgi:hypothetical protein
MSLRSSDILICIDLLRNDSRVYFGVSSQIRKSLRSSDFLICIDLLRNDSDVVFSVRIADHFATAKWCAFRFLVFL